MSAEAAALAEGEARKVSSPAGVHGGSLKPNFLEHGERSSLLVRQPDSIDSLCSDGFPELKPGRLSFSSDAVQGPSARATVNFSCFSSSSGPICRICHEGDQKETLVSPCRCSGTVGLVHMSCLEEWLSASNSEVCELCQHKFVVARFPRPFSDWFFGAGRGIQRSLLGDMVCFFLLTPLAFLSGILCLQGAAQQAEYHRVWETGCLVSLACMLFSVYVIWVFLTFRFHFKRWKAWREKHQFVKIVIYRSSDSSGQDSEGVNRQSHTSPGRELAFIQQERDTLIVQTVRSPPPQPMIPLVHGVGNLNELTRSRRFGGRSETAVREINLWL